MLYSFDVFDTLIYRKVNKPKDVFQLMEIELKKTGHQISGFDAVRYLAEKDLRKRARGSEIQYADIYNVVQERLGISEAEKSVLMEIEIKTEKHVCCLDENMLQQLKTIKASENRVVLISDFYLPYQDMRDILIELDPIFNEIPLYLSSTYGVRKKTGKLFQRVKKEENISYGDWTHIGDNPISDNWIPRFLGIHTVRIHPPKLFEFEKKLEISILSESLIVSLAQHGRVERGQAYQLGYSFAAPMILDYVQWILSEAIAKEYEILYFVMRDGYILKQVADMIIRKAGLSIKAELIYGSRIAWRRPNLTLKKLRCMSVWDTSNWLFHEPVTIEVILKRLGFSDNEIEVNYPNRNRILYTFADFKAFLTNELETENFRNLLFAKISDSKKSLKCYLEQTIEFDKKIAFADTNSTGKTQKELNDFIGDHLNQSNLTFFYHTYLGQKDRKDENKIIYTKDGSDELRFPEALLRAPINVVLGYEKNDFNQWQPYYFDGDIAWNSTFDFDDYLKGILDFVADFLQMEDKFGKINLQNYSNQLLRVANFSEASKELYDMIGDIPFNLDIKGGETKPFYPKLRIGDILHPFSKLIYLPKGAFYRSGHLGRVLYKILYFLVKIKRVAKR